MKVTRQITVLVAGLLLAGCSPTSAPTPTPTSETPPKTTMVDSTPPKTSAPPPSPSPSASPTAFESFPPPPADETAEQAAIRQGWMNYWKIYDKFARNPFVDDFTETQLVTAQGSKQSKVILDELQDLRERGWRVEGDHILRKYSILKPPSDVDGIRAAVITYCYDGRNKHVVEAESGASVATEAADTYVETAWMERGLDGVWRVAVIGNEAKSC